MIITNFRNCHNTLVKRVHEMSLADLPEVGDPIEFTYHSAGEVSRVSWDENFKRVEVSTTCRPILSE